MSTDLFGDHVYEPGVRSERDFYPTPLSAFTPLIPFVHGPVWEPACGDGRLCRCLFEARIDVYGSDLEPQFPAEKLDFLRGPSKRGVQTILTNPPFSLAFEFAQRAVRLAPEVFMLLPPISRNADIWTDIVRMRTLNSEQSRRNLEKHICPLQLDIIQRVITRYSNPREIVLDPFTGIGSVPFQAIKMKRAGWGIELNLGYWKDAVAYCERAEAEASVPTLFDLASVTIKAGSEVAA